MARKLSSLRFLAACTIAGSLLTGLAATSMAQGLPGLTIFSGVDRENQLGFRLDNSGRPGAEDRYRLRIPSDKMNLAVDQFTISYPDSFRGSFDPDRVELKAGGEEIALEDVVWDAENRVIEIYPQEPVPANERVEIILSDVQNPRTIGTHYFNATVRSPGDTLPLLRYIGTWIISISR